MRHPDDASKALALRVEMWVAEEPTDERRNLLLTNLKANQAVNRMYKSAPIEPEIAGKERHASKVMQ
jgi:hypothetical protein